MDIFLTKVVCYFSNTPINSLMYRTFFSKKGLEILEDQSDTFLECQMCTEKICRFRRCSDLLNSSIYCNSTNNCHSHITGHLTTSQGRFSASTFMSNHLTSEELFASTASTRYSATDPSPSTHYTQQMSSNSFGDINKKFDKVLFLSS